MTRSNNNANKNHKIRKTRVFPASEKVKMQCKYFSQDLCSAVISAEIENNANIEKIIKDHKNQLQKVLKTSIFEKS